MSPKIKRELECGVDCLLCEGCRTPKMPPSGDLNSNILIVGEAPGEDEDLEGIQFIGRAGKLLRDALAKAGITNYALDNSIKCRPPSNRNPTTTEIHTCLPYLMDTISKMPNLKLIVPLGNYALIAIAGLKNITKTSGKLMKVGLYDVLPIIHPAYVLRNQTESKRFYEHISRIADAVGGDLVKSSDFGQYIIVDSMEKWNQIPMEIGKTKKFAYDIETNGLNPFILPHPQIKCISIAPKPRLVYVLPLKDNKTHPPLDWDQIQRDLHILFTSKHIGKYGHERQFDSMWIKKVFDWAVRGHIWDTAFVAYLLNENETHGLKDLAWKISKCGGYEQRLSGPPHLIEGSELWEYCAIDSDITARLYESQYPEFSKDPELVKLLYTLMLPVSDVLTKMQLIGIKIDPYRLDKCSETITKVIDELMRDIKKEQAVASYEKDTETEFNPNSHIQLREVLFKYAGLKPVRLTDKTKAPSTDRESLEILAIENNLCSLLSEYSVYSSLRSKTINELYQYKTENDRIHTTFWLDRTTTGRSASSEPNQQNVVKGQKDRVGIRSIFVPDDGFIFAEADYSLHELRCMAEEAQDVILMDALKGDIHRSTAARALGKPEEQVTDDERRNVGKVLNFSLIYNVTDYGLSRQLKCTEVEAHKYKERFFNSFYKTSQWMQDTAEFVKKNGYVRSRTGRYRRFPVYDELNDKMIREAINFPIQSLAGDILLYALIGVDRFLTMNNLKTFITLEIHDSILFNVHKSELNILPTLQDIMCEFPKKYIPFSSNLKVDLKIGENWGNLKEY